MSKIKNINAFPSQELHPINNRLIGQNYGMTLRDYFAAKAMQARWSNPDEEDYQYTAKSSYKMADAMLKERANADS